MAFIPPPSFHLEVGEFFLIFVKIVGLTDPWYVLSYNEDTNENIHIFKTNIGHTSMISSLSNEDQQAFWSTVNSILSK